MLQSVLLIMIMLVACVLVIAALRRASWKTLAALPLGLLLLGIVGVLLLRPTSSFTYVPHASVEVQNWSIDHFGSVMHNEDRTRGDGAVHLKAAMIVLPMLFGIAVCVAILILCRKWIARNAGVLIPIAGIGSICALAGGMLSGAYLVWNTQMTERESALRAQKVQELRALGESLHHHSLHDLQGGVISTSADEPAEPLPSNTVLAVATDVAIADPAATAAETPDAATETPATAPTPELPEWARGETVDSRSLRQGVHQNPVTLKSDQWSSVQETEVQLEAMAMRALRQQLQMERGSTFHWEPSVDFIHQSGAIQQRFVEQTSLKVGEFESPMYRSYWQVAATPHVSELAHAQWKATAIEERLIWLGAGAAALTLLFAGTAASLRIDAATGGRYRRRYTAATVALISLAVGTAALFVA